MTKGPRTVWDAAKAQANYQQLRVDADAYNAANRWRKRGVYMMGTDYKLGKAVSYSGWQEKCSVRVEADGMVTLDHTGIELGQGIDTKAAQAAVHELLAVAADFEISKIKTISPKSTSNSSWSTASPTYGSGTSEAVTSAVSDACSSLAKLLQKYKDKGNWHDIVAAAIADKVDLSTTGSHSHFRGILGYHVYVAACVVAEIDVLTGETHILSADIVQDAGKSLNPAVDIGQIEGCFVQAMGFCLTEEQVYSKKDGRLVNAGSWDYKIPSAQDVPIRMNVSLLPSENTSWGAVFSSKATGEPTYCLGGVTFFAVKDAIYAARKDAGVTGYFRIDCPASPSAVQTACLVNLGPHENASIG